MVSIIISALIITYVLMVLILWLGWEKAGPFQEVLVVEQPVSIVIAIRNEAENIVNLLQDIRDQDYPQEMVEVILIDDHSTDNTVDLVSKFIKSDKLNINLFSLINEEGKKAAIHEGVQKASHELIITTDGDCRAQPDWITSMLAFFTDQNTQLVSGPVRIYPQESFFSRLQGNEFTTLISSGAATIALGWPTMANGANLAYRKSAYHEVSERYENAASGDDVFLLHKIKDKYPEGICFCKDKNAIVDTPAASSINSFYNQRKRWASKWGEYRHWPTKLLAVLIFCVNMGVLLLPVLAVFNMVTWVLAANLFVVKFVFEFWFIKTVQKFFNVEFRLYEFVILTLIYPFYVTFIAVAGLFSKYEWKGRRTI